MNGPQLLRAALLGTRQSGEAIPVFPRLAPSPEQQLLLAAGTLAFMRKAGHQPPAPTTAPPAPAPAETWVPLGPTGAECLRATRLLRGQDVDASSAHAIEGVRLAAALATVRGLALPGIDELQEAAVAILGGGYAEPLALVHKELVIGVKLGEVPAGLPATPLQQDLTQQQKSLRLKPEATPKPLDLDLRQPTQLDRSHLLHRLRLLDINWGEPEEVAGKSGTFHELWIAESGAGPGR